MALTLSDGTGLLVWAIPRLPSKLPAKKYCSLTPGRKTAHTCRLLGTRLLTGTPDVLQAELDTLQLEE